MMKALLFDLDGTLVDTIPTWIEANIRILKEFGIQMDQKVFLQEYYQKGLHFKGILEKCGLDLSLGDTFYPKRDDLYIELLGKNVEWIDTAGKILEKCAAKIPLGLMTGSKKSFIDALEPKLRLTHLFKAIITYDDTGERMKPDPYGLLLLTGKLGVDPAACLYVGDQTEDTIAARNAGMKSCLIPFRETPKGAEEEADYVIASLGDLLKPDAPFRFSVSS